MIAAYWRLGVHRDQEPLVIVHAVAGYRIGQHQRVDRVDFLLPLGIRGAGLWLKGIRGHATCHPRACESKHSSPSDDISASNERTAAV